MSCLLLKPSSFLDVDLNPQPLAVETVLPALVFAQHRLIALVQILVGAPPGVVDAHRVVGRDRAVDEAEDAVLFFAGGPQAAQFVECVGVLPKFQRSCSCVTKSTLFVTSLNAMLFSEKE